MEQFIDACAVELSIYLGIWSNIRKVKNVVVVQTYHTTLFKLESIFSLLEHLFFNIESGVSSPKTSCASAKVAAVCSLNCFINPIAS